MNEEIPGSKTSQFRRFRNVSCLVVVGAMVGALVVGIAGAETGTPPGASYTSLPKPVSVEKAASVAAGKSVSPVIIGGTTGVPSDATAVEVNVTVTGAISLYPAGDPTATDAGEVANGSQTIQVTPGLKGELTFMNTGSSTAKVTALIEGYTNQITASQVALDGGQSGDVLTNNGGIGAQWEPVPTAPAPGAYSSDDVLTNAFPAANSTYGVAHLVGEGQSSVTYFATFTAQLQDTTDVSPAQVKCWFTDDRLSEQYNPVTVTLDSANPDVSIATQGLITDPNGDGIYVACSATTAFTVSVPTVSLTLIVEGSPNGNIGS
jgi:hypothetical protein